MKSFQAMLSFFTTIPIRIKFEIDDDLYKKGMKYLFVIALIIGIPVGFAAYLQRWIGSYIAAFISFGLYLVISGGLHIDGLADTMDAFGSNKDRQRMLDIMKDSHIGTFGVLSISVYSIGMVLFIAQANYAVAGLFPLVGRTAALMCARLFYYARPAGTAKCFVDGAKTVYVAVSVLAYIVIVVLFCYDFSTLKFDGRHAVILFLPYMLSIGAVVLCVLGMSRKLGGITGDVIGFGIEASQLLYLLGSSILLKIW
ncbi:MAG: adenosylcobinamide-GDP ribazoletransferase [Christensenellales bacterium]